MTQQVQPGDLPLRLTALGWKRDLYVRGRLATGPAVAIVGARAASMDGMRRAHALARHFVGRGVHVVSGGALGIDGAAHRGALERTTVVLGSGCDVYYPARHAPMFDQILAHGGAIVSLWPDGTQPRAGRFVARNPLIAALADLVIVVEANVRSGSLSTAAAAQKYGLTLAACPGSPGSERLLDAGAALIESTHDADAALSGAPRVRPLDPIAAAIAAGARDVDAIVAATGLPVRTVVRALARLT